MTKIITVRKGSLVSHKRGRIMARHIEPPGVPAPKGLQELGTGFAGSADTVSACEDTILSGQSLPLSPCIRLMAGGHCCACHSGYFTAIGPAPQPSPVWTGGRL